MKVFLIAIISGIFFFSSCAESTVQTRNLTDSEKDAVVTREQNQEKEEVECKICDFDYENYKGELSKEEIKGLLLALNDEYMAWATYDRINKDFEDPRPFANIQKSEERHAGRLKALFKTYKLPVPENKWVGDTPRFESVKAACKSGIDGEIANAALYERLFKSTDREDILFVYKNLKRASEENHLPAFKRCSEGRGRGFGGGRGYGRGRGQN